MRNKDLYYKKYLKYKNKYLNLRILIGGSPSDIPYYDNNGLFLKTIDNKKLLYIIEYNINYSFFNSKHINIDFILYDLVKYPNITTIKLNNLHKLYSAYYYIGLSKFYNQIPEFPDHITTLIFDGNQLSEIGIIDLIINFIKKFEMVSSLSFKLCKLTDKSAKYLQQELLELKKTKTITNIYFQR